MSKLIKDKRYLKNYWVYLKKYQKALNIGLLLIPIVSLLHIIQPYLIKLAIDDYIVVGNMNGLNTIIIMFAAAIIFDFTAKTIQMYIFQYIGQKTVMDIRKDLFIHIINYAPSYFDKTPVGVLISRLTSDIESLNESFSSGLVTLIADFLTLIGIVVMMFILSPKLTVITLIVVPPLMIMVNFFRIKLRHYFDIIRSTIGKMNGYIQEQLQGIAVIQIFMQELKSFTVFKKLNRRYYESTIASVSYDAMLYSLIDMINSIMIALMIWYGWGQYQADIITIGLLVAFVDYIHRFFMPLKEISNKFAILQHALAALEKIFGTFETKEFLPEGNATLPEFNGNITFNNINFAYQGHEDKPILSNINFSIKPGDVCALVGPTGSGKTTILKLLGKLYTGYTGEIYFDNKEIQTLTTHTLRSKIAIVSQDISLFSGSIRFNISLGNKNITEERMIWAAKLVQIHDVIQKLPAGYDTELTKGSSSLSVGQSQLLCFARALASHAPILLLDEATSSVDSLSEKLIQEALLTLFKHKTTLVVAHRLSTITHANTILVLNQGKIIEKGTHETLMMNDAFYAKLFKMQFASL
ncbi:antibiotic ABC transporter ATP-binding protein [Candidatus Marinamargulisbacteria bacterium SCGC AG-414-C22]|nr:antibiotic ABC transporter ATP-binding protein [Candidatus Marinamargulisbacteria bacterium SCGC AG-414-C22]